MWHQWKGAEFLQLGCYEKLEMYGPPQNLSPNSILLHLHWKYHFKKCGTRYFRQCEDGSVQVAPVLHTLANIYVPSVVMLC